MKTENKIQSEIISRIRGSVGRQGFVFPMDGSVYQGFPDILILMLNGSWGVLEVKRTRNEKRQPNQKYYIKLMDSSGVFSKFIYPENMEEVLYELQRTLLSKR